MSRALRPLSLAVCLLGALVWHGRQLGQRGYWEDEIYTARDIGIETISDHDPSFRLSFDHLTYRNDNHPPLYFWLISRWTSWFGFSETASRGFSLLFFIATLLVCARVIGEWAPEWRFGTCWAVLLAGFSPALAEAAREARMYALALFFVSLSLLFFGRVWRAMGEGATPAWTDLSGLAAANALGLYTHYYHVWLWMAEIGLTLSFAASRRACPKRPLLPTICALLASGFLFAPWLPQLQRQYAVKFQPGLWVIGPEPWGSYLSRLATAIRGPVGDLTAAEAGWWGSLAVIAILGSLAVGFRRKGRSAAVMPGLGGVALLLAIANDLYHHTVTIGSTKYMFAVLLPLSLAILVGLAGLPKGPRPFVALALVVVNLVAMTNHFGKPRHPDWRKIAAAVERSDALPTVVRDANYLRCLRFYLAVGREIVVDRDSPSLPAEFTYLALYPNWSRENRSRLDELMRSYQTLAVTVVDEHSELVHFRGNPGSLRDRARSRR